STRRRSESWGTRAPARRTRFRWSEAVTRNAPEILETSRLVLRKPRMSDADDVFHAYASDPMATRYLLFTPHRDVDQSRVFLQERLTLWGGGTEISWAITAKPDDRLVGMASCRFDRHRADLGYVLTRPLWGRGYMSEAVRAVVEWAIAQD